MFLFFLYISMKMNEWIKLTDEWHIFFQYQKLSTLFLWSFIKFVHFFQSHVSLKLSSVLAEILKNWNLIIHKNWNSWNCEVQKPYNLKFYPLLLSQKSYPLVSWTFAHHSMYQIQNRSNLIEKLKNLFKCDENTSVGQKNSRN